MIIFISAMLQLCVEFPQGQYIDLMFWKLSSFRLVTIFVVSHFLIATFKVSPKWKLKPCFWNQKKCPRCPFNRGNKDKDYVNIFPGPNFVSPEWRCPLNRGLSKGEAPTRSKGWPNSLQWKTLDSCSVMQCLKFIFSTYRPGLESL